MAFSNPLPDGSSCFSVYSTWDWLVIILLAYLSTAWSVVHCRDGCCLIPIIFRAVCMTLTRFDLSCTERLPKQAVMPNLIRLSKADGWKTERNYSKLSDQFHELLVATRSAEVVVIRYRVYISLCIPGQRTFNTNKWETCEMVSVWMTMNLWSHTLQQRVKEPSPLFM